MRTALFTLLALALVPTSAPLATARAADPIDELVARLVEQRAKKAELEKAVAETEAELRRRFAELHDRLAKLGVIAPGPPPPAPDPKPADILKTRLRAAFKDDNGTRDQALHLAELYRQAAKLAQDKAAVATTAELLARVRVAADELLKDFGPDTLKAVRTVAQSELRFALGKSDDSPITDEERKAAATLFARLAEILEGF